MSATTLIPEEHPMMQFVLRFLLVYHLSTPGERSQSAQKFATALANREQLLMDALVEIGDLAGDIRLMDGSYLSDHTRAVIAKVKGEV